MGHCSCVFTARAASFGLPARGFDHLIRATAHVADPMETSTGWTRLDMDLRCHQWLAHQPGQILHLPAGQTVNIGRRVVTDCVAPCAPELRQRINFSGWAWANGDPGRVGAAETDLTYSIDAQTVWIDEVKAEKSAIVVPGDDDHLLASRRQQGESGLLDTSSQATISNFYSTSTIYSSTKAEFDLIAKGKLECIGLTARASLHARQWETGTPAEIELFGGEEDEEAGGNG